jgi:hypothetical protein
LLQPTSSVCPKLLCGCQSWLQPPFQAASTLSRYPDGGRARHSRKTVRRRFGIGRTGSARNLEIDLSRTCYFQRSRPGIEHFRKGRHRGEGSGSRSSNLYTQIQKWQRYRSQTTVWRRVGFRAQAIHEGRKCNGAARGPPCRSKIAGLLRFCPRMVIHCSTRRAGRIGVGQFRLEPEWSLRRKLHTAETLSNLASQSRETPGIRGGTPRRAPAIRRSGKGAEAGWAAISLNSVSYPSPDNAPTAPLNGARPGRIYPRRRVKRQDRKIFMPPTIARFIANIHGAFARSDFWKRGMAIAAS